MAVGGIHNSFNRLQRLKDTGMNHHLVRQQSDIEHKLNSIIERLRRMSRELDQLTAQVKSNSAVLDSAIVLINGIADRITAAGVDPAKLQALTDELKAKDDVLAAAVVANTPAPQV